MSEASRGRRAAHRADCMDAKKTGGGRLLEAEAAEGGGAQRQP